MSRISSTVGLVTGLPIQQTVEQLLAISARPRALLVSRNETLLKKQTAVADLTAAVLGVQFAAAKLTQEGTFTQKVATPSNPAVLAASITGSPPTGNYEFTAVRRAQAEHLLGGGVADRGAPLGAGKLTLNHGGFLDEAAPLAELNGGAGVARGKIRVTDRSGGSAVIDLRYAQTVDDVLAAIHSAEGIDVRAETRGDAFFLRDLSGGAGQLRVEEVSGGTTALGLGLAGIAVAADEATGTDVRRLYEGLALDRLNDGAGLSLREGLPDLDVTFRDGTSLFVDFRRAARAEGFAGVLTTAAAGANARVQLTAKTAGAAYDGVTVKFIDSGAVTQGGETVVYDASNPNAKTLTFDIDAGATTADDLAAAVGNNPTVSALFAASANGDGAGLVALTDGGVTRGGAALAARDERTLGDLLATLNAADPSRLKAELAPSGDRLVLTDLTQDYGQTFAVASPLGGELAADLGLTGTAVGGQLTGGRLLGGLKSPLLASLNGGKGLGPLGELSLTDRSGAQADVDLSAAETLDDVLTAINAAGLGLTASLNANRSGLLLTDTSGGAGPLVAASGDAAQTAEKLGLAGSTSQSTRVGQPLRVQTVAEATRLASLRGGRVPTTGSFSITDSAGQTGVVNLSLSAAETVGDVLDAINALSVGVTARLNDAGDGIVVIDDAGGAGTLEILDIGSGKAAAGLGIKGRATQVTLDGQPKMALVGTTAYAVELDADDDLDDLAAKLNALGAGVNASVIHDGGAAPYRLSLLSADSGRAGRLQVDGAAVGLSFERVAEGRDALLAFGASGAAGVLASSANNRFDGLVDGLSLTVLGESTAATTVTVAASDSSLVSTVQVFVDAYNRLQDKLAEHTSYEAESGKSGALFGSGEALRVEADLTRLLSGRSFAAGSLQTLEQLGISFKDDGKLAFSATELKSRYAADREQVQKFFADEERGLAVKLNAVIETLAGRGDSLLVSRAGALQRQVDLNRERIDFQTARLARERERLLKQFYNLELAIGKIQSNLTYINSIQAIPPLGSGGG